MNDNTKQASMDQLERMKHELRRKERKLRRYSQLLDAQKHVRDTLRRQNEPDRLMDTQPKQEIEMRGIQGESKPSQTSRTVKFSEDAPEIIFVTPSPSLQSKRSRIHRKGHHRAGSSLHTKRRALQMPSSPQENEEMTVIEETTVPKAVPSTKIIRNEGDRVRMNGTVNEELTVDVSMEEDGENDIFVSESILSHFENCNRNESNCHASLSEHPAPVDTLGDVSALSATQRISICSSSEEVPSSIHAADGKDFIKNTEETPSNSSGTKSDSISESWAFWAQSMDEFRAKEVVGHSNRSTSSKMKSQASIEHYQLKDYNRKFKDNKIRRVGDTNGNLHNINESQDLFCFSQNIPPENIEIKRSWDSHKKRHRKHISSQSSGTSPESENGVGNKDQEELDKAKVMEISPNYPHSQIEHPSSDDRKDKFNMSIKQEIIPDSHVIESRDRKELLMNVDDCMRFKSTRIKCEQTLQLDSNRVKTSLSKQEDDMLMHITKSLESKGALLSVTKNPKVQYQEAQNQNEKADNTTSPEITVRLHNELEIKGGLTDSKAMTRISQSEDNEYSHEEMSWVDDSFTDGLDCEEIEDDLNDAFRNTDNSSEHVTTDQKLDSGKKSVKLHRLEIDVCKGKILTTSVALVSNMQQERICLLIVQESGFSLWYPDVKGKPNLKWENPALTEVSHVQDEEWILLSEFDHDIGPTTDIRNTISMGLPSEEEIRFFVITTKNGATGLDMMYVQYNQTGEWLITEAHLGPVLWKECTNLQGCSLGDWCVAVHWKTPDHSPERSLLVVDFDVSYSRRSKKWELHLHPSLRSPPWANNLASLVVLNQPGPSSVVLCISNGFLYMYDAVEDILLCQFPYHKSHLCWAEAVKDLVFVMRVDFSLSQLELCALNPMTSHEETFYTWLCESAAKTSDDIKDKHELCISGLVTGASLKCQELVATFGSDIVAHIPLGVLGDVNER